MGSSKNLDNCKAVLVWDPFVRLSHWSLVVAFFIAYFTEDDLLTLHVWAGYAIGMIVILRVLWGFWGPKHARFSDFVFGPWKIWSYLIDVARFRAERYLGHNPAGGAMVIALLVGLSATVWSGLELYAIEENRGPLASTMQVVPSFASAAPRVRLASSDEREEKRKTESHERRKDHDDGF